MNIFKTASLQHVGAVQRLLRLYAADASLDLASYVLEVRARNRYYSFYPQFMSIVEGRPRFSTSFEENVRGFVGWLPYFNKQWPTGTSKFAFKEYCAANGLRTPKIWRSPAPDLRDFVIKRNFGSFGEGLRGPFHSHDSENPARALGEDGYFEAFTRGRILKAFYWNERLGCLEVLDMPSVAGDGKSTLRELIARKLGPHIPQSEWRDFPEVAAYQGMTLDAIPRDGQSVMIDFRYGSSAHPVTYDNPNVLARIQNSPIVQQLVECGRVLRQSIPEDTRDATLFSVDAVADDEDRVWLLEMNCNPVLQPDMYPLMFEQLFGPVQAEASAGAHVSPPQSGIVLRGAARPAPAMPLVAGARPWRLS